MLTNTKCRNAKPRPKPYKLADGHGLYLEVRPTGAKFWRYRYEISIAGERRERIFTIGKYAVPPTVETEAEAKLRQAGHQLTLAEAREARVKARALVVQGICPVEDQRRQRAKRDQQAAATVQALAEEWIQAKTWEDDTKRRRRDMLERVVHPHIGTMAVSTVTPADVLAVLRRASENNGPSVAAEAQRTLAGIFGHAVATLRIESDPVAPIRHALPPNKTQHKRPLTRDELGKLLRDIDGYERNHQTVAAFKFMWLTLCRPGEVVGAQWDEVDWTDGLWRIPAERMKMRRPHIVPLPTQAIHVLQNMRGLTGQHAHIFPHRDKRTEGMTEHTLRQALKQLGWAGTFSPHATRATGSTMLNEMGYNADWIERQLAHGAQNSVRSSYNQALHIRDRKVMMQAWADFLDGLRSANP